MNTSKIAAFENAYKVARPNISIGDTVIVDTIIRDGEKKRIQKFKGIVIAMKGKGASRTFTVRKISYGIGVEKIFPLNSPNIESIEIVKHAKVRRSKLYYLRNRIGKAATTLRGGKTLTEESNALVEVEQFTLEQVESEISNSEIADEAKEAKTVSGSTSEGKTNEE